MHYVYLLENSAGRRYVGYTSNLRQRFADHDNAKNVGTASVRPWQLRAYMAFSNKSQALAFENDLKSGSGHAFARRRFW